LRFNILKPIYHRATMKAYYDRLRTKRIKCHYIDYDPKKSRNHWIQIVREWIKTHGSNLQFFDPVDRTLEQIIDKNFDQYDIINTPRFILTDQELEQYNGPLRQTSFYSWVRLSKNILMKKQKTDKPLPEGGKMTYDVENRKSPYPGIEADIQEDPDYRNNPYVIDAMKWIEHHYPIKNYRIWKNDSQDHIFDSLDIKFPVDIWNARLRLKYFIKNNLDQFGDYQDVLLDLPDKSLLFHSGLSPMLNIGLLTPDEVISAVIEYYENKSPKQRKQILHNVEGFIRQILGWREFCRYIYEYHSDIYLSNGMNNNFFNSNQKLGSEWYSGTTDIYPIDQCIEKAFRTGYLHHIERLMVVANFMTISNIEPSGMYKWFMEFSLDSYDWVMEYNVYCMGSYSDGGNVTTKPYISSSQYLLKMSDYKKKDSDSEQQINQQINQWISQWDDLFWRFIRKHKNKIKKIGRLSNLIKYIKNHL
jgi:deoxyribodipyrimidine photolyase-related protein